MRYRFDNYELDDATGDLVRPDASQVRLRQKATSLLVALLAHPRRLITKEELITIVWGPHPEAGDHELQGLKNELQSKLQNDKLIKAVPGKGYTFHARAVATLPDGDRHDGRSALHIFPGLGTAAGTLFVHSWVGYGANDFVKHIQQEVQWEVRTRHMVMLSNEEPSTVVIPFRHVVKTGSEAESR